MKRTAPKIEKQILLTLLETTSAKIRAYIYQHTESDDFGLDWGYEVRERVSLLRRLSKPVGRAIDMSEDPALSKEAQQWIKSTPKNRRAAKTLPLKRVEYMLRVLHTHRKIRMVDDGLEAISKEAEGRVGRTQIQNIEHHLEGMLSGIRRTEEKDPFLHLGMRANISEVKARVERILDPANRRMLSTGIGAIDQHLAGGFEPGDLITLSSPSGGGKSLVANAMAINQYRKKKLNVCVVSMEMTKDQLLQRTIANLAEINNTNIRDPDRLRKEQIQLIRKSVRNFVRWGKKRGCEFTIRDVSDPDYTPEKMVSELAPFKYDVIYVDYITLFSMKGKAAWEMQMENSRYLKLVAPDLGAAIVVLTQLSDDEKIKYGRAIKENSDYWFWFSWQRRNS